MPSKTVLPVPGSKRSLRLLGCHMNSADMRWVARKRLTCFGWAPGGLSNIWLVIGLWDTCARGLCRVSPRRSHADELRPALTQATPVVPGQGQTSFPRGEEASGTTSSHLDGLLRVGCCLPSCMALARRIRFRRMLIRRTPGPNSQSATAKSVAPWQISHF